MQKYAADGQDTPGMYEKMRNESIATPTKPKVALQDLVSCWPEKLNGIVEDLKGKHPSIGSILLHGKPGTGKTIAVHMMALATGRILYELNTGKIFGPTRGATTRLNEFFDAIKKKNEPCIVFIDEIHRLAATYSSNDQDAMDAIASFLMKVNDCNEDPQKLICIIGATYIEETKLDNAYQSRVWQEVQLELPNEEMRKKVLALYLNKKDALINQDASPAITLDRSKLLVHLAKETTSFSIRDLVKLVDSAAQLASGKIPRGEHFKKAIVDIKQFKEKCARQEKTEPWYQSWYWMTFKEGMNGLSAATGAFANGMQARASNSAHEKNCLKIKEMTAAKETSQHNKDKESHA